MTNSEIASAFTEIADILEFQGANAFRVRAYRNGARTINELSEPLERVVRDPSRKLTDFTGIGAELAAKIGTLVNTGSLPMLEELKAQVPPSAVMLLRIPGLGPKKAARLFNELGVSSLDELRTACETHKVQELAGFGSKTEAAILAGMTLAQSPEFQRIYWADADVFAQAMLAHLRACESIKQMQLAGSYRRGQETIGDLDIVVDSENPAEVMDRLAEYAGIQTVLGRGDTKMSVRLGGGPQVDVRIVPTEAYGAALLYFTGSKQHNIVLRGLAKDRGMRINEYGIFAAPKVVAKDVDDDSGAVDVSKLEYLAGRTEAEIYAKLDLPVIPPELREARWEFEWAATGAMPELIALEDLRGDLHMHTTASDGKASLAEMVAAARDRGRHYIAITDHSKRATIANGLDATRLLRQWEEVDRFNAQLLADEPNCGFRVLKGCEVDILERGGLDIDDATLAQADWIVASVHYGQNQSSEQITRRIVDAIANPYLCAIAHPTGRLIGRRGPYDVDLEAVFEAAKRHGKFLELNSNPARLDLNDINCAAAKRHGVSIVISSDAHNTTGMDVLRFGILQAHRAGLTKADVANTRTWEQMRQMLRRE